MAQSNGTGAAGIGPARSAGRAILWGGLICSVLDITSAVIISFANKGSPIRMLQGIAGALLTGDVSGRSRHRVPRPRDALRRGPYRDCGFYWLSRRFPVMVEWAVPAGLLFGVVWLFVMYRRVIPLTAALRSLYLSITSSDRCWPSGRCLCSSI